MDKAGQGDSCQDPVSRFPRLAAACAAAERRRHPGTARPVSPASRQLLYQAHTLRPLFDVQYGFQETDLADAGQRFVSALKACDQQLERRDIPLSQRACRLPL